MAFISPWDYVGGADIQLNDAPNSLRVNVAQKKQSEYNENFAAMQKLKTAALSLDLFFEEDKQKLDQWNQETAAMFDSNNNVDYSNSKNLSQITDKFSKLLNDKSITESLRLQNQFMNQAAIIDAAKKSGKGYGDANATNFYEAVSEGKRKKGTDRSDWVRENGNLSYVPFTNISEAENECLKGLKTDKKIEENNTVRDAKGKLHATGYIQQNTSETLDQNKIRSALHRCLKDNPNVDAQLKQNAIYNYNYEKKINPNYKKDFAGKYVKYLADTDIAIDGQIKSTEIKFNALYDGLKITNPQIYAQLLQKKNDDIEALQNNKITIRTKTDRITKDFNSVTDKELIDHIVSMDTEANLSATAVASEINNFSSTMRPDARQTAVEQMTYDKSKDDVNREYNRQQKELDRAHEMEKQRQGNLQSAALKQAEATGDYSGVLGGGSPEPIKIGDSSNAAGEDFDPDVKVKAPLVSLLNTQTNSIFTEIKKNLNANGNYKDVKTEDLQTFINLRKEYLKDPQGFAKAHSDGDSFFIDGLNANSFFNEKIDDLIEQSIDTEKLIQDYNKDKEVINKKNSKLIPAQFVSTFATSPSLGMNTSNNSGYWTPAHTEIEKTKSQEEFKKHWEQTAIYGNLAIPPSEAKQLLNIPDLEAKLKGGDGYIWGQTDMPFITGDKQTEVQNAIFNVADGSVSFNITHKGLKDKINTSKTITVPANQVPDSLRTKYQRQGNNNSTADFLDRTFMSVNLEKADADLEPVNKPIRVVVDNKNYFANATRNSDGTYDLILPVQEGLTHTKPIILENVERRTLQDTYKLKQQVKNTVIANKQK